MLKHVREKTHQLLCETSSGISQKENSSEDNHQVTNPLKSEIKFYKKASPEESSVNTSQESFANETSSFRLLKLKRKCSCFKIEPSRRVISSQQSMVKTASLSQEENATKPKMKSSNNAMSFNNFVLDKDDLLKVYL